MKLSYKLVVAAVIAATPMFAGSAWAAPTIYTSQAAFNAATSGDTLYGFPFTVYSDLSPSYTNGPVTFTSSKLHAYNDAYGKPYISDNDFGGKSGNTFTIASTTSALGLFLGSYFGKASYSYLVNGVAGSFTVPARNDTTFLGFTSSSGPVSVVFNVAGGNDSSNNELDVPQFIAGSAIVGGVPEPATWAMMLFGFGGIGFAMRRRPRNADGLSQAF